mmetsp:Transcript_54943/g.128496  ORF Transcript_54943/g.128496 Transcript_54943/m.128496 type:complete len:598 (-) Transcript_54943:249-2042(-)
MAEKPEGWSLLGAVREAKDYTWTVLSNRVSRLRWGQHAKWYVQMDYATTFQEWLEAAQKLDEIEGHDKWKEQDESPLYDSQLIRERVEKMKELEEAGDLEGIMFHLRAGMVRGLGGVGNPQLHTHAYVGTKRLIEEHTKQIFRLLQVLHDAPEDQLPLEKKLAFFAESRHALGKTALLLSGGASLGMYHFGVLKTLHENNLLPRVLSGSSAGSIVAALVGVRTSEELTELFTPGSLDLTFFPPAGSLRRKVRRVLTQGHLMEVKVLQKALQTNLGDLTFYEAYERTGRILNITVSPASDYERPRLLNYLTSPNVLIWSAACASCAFPILFQPVELVAKNEQGEIVQYHVTDVKWQDGSLQTDIPTTRLSELFNVNHFIVSQTNPHAIPFMSKGRSVRKGMEHKRNDSPGLISRGWSVLRYLITSEAAHRFKQAINMGLVPKILEATLFQRLSGDITIVPPFSLKFYTQIISNPTWQTIEKFMADASRCTWPNISFIKNHCEVEMRLDALARDLAKQAEQRPDESSHIAVMYATPGMPPLEGVAPEEETEHPPAPPIAEWLQHENFDLGAGFWYGSGEVTDPEQLAAVQENGSWGNPR